MLWHGHVDASCTVVFMVQQVEDAHCALSAAAKGLPLCTAQLSMAGVQC